MIIFIVIVCVAVAVDICTKKWVVKNMKIGQRINLYKDKVALVHVKNEGATYGLLKNNKKLLAVLSVISMGILGFVIKDYYDRNDKIGILGTSLMVAGGIGNMLERYRKHEVTDFLYIKFKKAPIFNVADVCVWIGSIINIVGLIKK